MPRSLTLLLFPMFFAAACGQSASNVEIPFEARYAGQRVSCDSHRDALSLTDLRFYVSRVFLVNRSGGRVPLKLLPDGEWQMEGLALLDLENGQGSCLNGTPGVNTTLRGTAEGEDFRGLEFEIGVPESLNHGDPLIAKAPLTNTPMHWHWRSGYKFLRVGVRTPKDGFWMHVGSARCAGTIGDLSHCRSSNRIEVSLPEFDPGRGSVVIDLDTLLGMTDLGDGQASDCSSGPDEMACEGPFRMLGIDVKSGRAIAPAQAIVSVATP